MCRWVDERGKMQWVEFIVEQFQLNKQPSLLRNLKANVRRLPAASVTPFTICTSDTSCKRPEEMWSLSVN
jgi:hypothetical protein